MKPKRAETTITATNGVDFATNLAKYLGLTPQKPKLGDVVSEGTLRDQDLLRNFADALEGYSPVNDIYLVRLSRVMADVADLLDEHPGVLYDKKNNSILREEISVMINETLSNRLNNLAPEGTYFGVNVGDGSLFGFWRLEDIDVYDY